MAGIPKVVTLILAGGQGSRLYPLTKVRSKPAVPIAGRFRLIDERAENHAIINGIIVIPKDVVIPGGTVI